MTDPQPRHLKPPPRRAEPWQPDRPGDVDVDRSTDAAGTPARPPTSPSIAADGSASQRLAHPGGAHGNVEQAVQSATSPEAKIPRDAQTGQALDDPSLHPGDASDLPDGRAGSMHLPES